jgi:hypothetical protein
MTGLKETKRFWALALGLETFNDIVLNEKK